MSVRTPFQLYKADHPDGTMPQFHELPKAIALRYKIAAAEGKLMVLLGPEEHRDALSSSAKGSIAKGLHDLLQLLVSVEVQSPVKNSSRARSQSASQQGAPIANLPLLQTAIRVVGAEVAALTKFTTADFETVIAKVKEAEGLLKKSARSEPSVDEPLRKSARIQSQREAQAAEQDVKVIEPPKSSSVVPKPSAVTTTKAVRNNANVVDLSRDSLSTQPIAPPPRSPAQERQAISSAFTSEIDLTHGEVSCAISVMSDGALAESEEPAARPPPDSMLAGTAKKSRTAKVSKAKATDNEVLTAPLDEEGTKKPNEPKPKSDAAPTRPATKQQRTLFQDRRPALVASERKVIRDATEMIYSLASAYTSKDLNLLPLFEQLRATTTQLADLVEKELQNYPPETHDITKPIPFHNVDVSKITAAIDASRKRFEANDNECCSEFDEYLLHPIAHRIITLINTLEGHQSRPEKIQTKEEFDARQKAREAEKAKRDEIHQKQVQKMNDRISAAAKKEEEKQVLRNLTKTTEIDVEQLVEDTELLGSSPLGYVHYGSLPLPLEYYEMALTVWAMIVSVPRPLMLSQCPFALFASALTSNRSDNGLMEEVFKSLNDINIAHANAIAPTIGTPKINSRGKDWFAAAVEFIAITSGSKKTTRAKVVVQSSSEEDDSSADESSSDDSTTSEDDEESAAEDVEDVTSKKDEENEEAAGGQAAEEAAAAANPDDLLSPFERKVKATMEVITELRGYASWGNIDIADRITMLQYAVHYALDTDPVREEADRLFKSGQDDEAAYQKKITETRSTGEKDLRTLVRLEAQSKKPVAVGAEQPKPINFAKKKAEIVTNMENLLREARINKFTTADQEDQGTRISPLGQDRYRRIYWRMPLDKFVLVQSVMSYTQAFPTIDTPPPLPETAEGAEAAAKQRAILIDEEEPSGIAASRKRGRQSNQSSPSVPDVVEVGPPAQFTWGVIRSEYLPQFVDSLDPRGKREGPLRLALQPLCDYLKHLEAPHEGVRMTRSRAAAQGYLNKLRAF